MLLNKARGLLRFVQTFLDLVHAVGQRIIRQQVQARQQAVERRHALFACSYCTRFCWLSLSWALSARSSSPRRLLSLRILFFRIVLESHRQMAADKAAEGLVQALGFLHIERQGRKTL